VDLHINLSSPSIDTGFDPPTIFKKKSTLLFVYRAILVIIKASVLNPLGEWLDF
jgi:hypothetical protein